MTRVGKNPGSKRKETLSEKIERAAYDEKARKRTFDRMKKTVYNITQEDMNRRFDI